MTETFGSAHEVARSAARRSRKHEPAMLPQEIERRLDAFARSGGIVPVTAFYIWGEFRVENDGQILYSDEGLEYCRACAETLLASVLPLLRSDEREDHRVSATDLHHEDTCKHCITCGALLDYALNETGVSSELDHYQTYNLSEELRPGDAFHIARLVEAAPADRAVLRLARDALRRTPRPSRASAEQNVCNPSANSDQDVKDAVRHVPLPVGRDPDV